ncbi:MAG: hypothetical protein GQ559_04360 [Desulfobulbaceae bacterium]|nr:hypothetical protein [Desulfobulbaceae bacterium]
MTMAMSWICEVARTACCNSLKSLGYKACKVAWGSRTPARLSKTLSMVPGYGLATAYQAFSLREGHRR